MLVAALATLTLAQSAFVSDGRPSYMSSEQYADWLVEAAWDEEAQRAQQAQKRDSRHEEDLKNDREVGEKYSKLADKEFKASKDKDAIERVQRIGAELSEIANRAAVSVTWGDKRLNPFEYSFKLVEGEDVNAFSLPGGFIYIFEGLVKFAESDDELAGVVGHEIAHAALRHVATLEREQQKVDIFQIPLILIAIAKGGRSGGEIAQGALLAGTAMSNGWTMKAEQAADYAGLQYLAKSKYDPTGMLTFMERLASKDRREPRRYADLGIFRTHPPSKERADAITKRMRSAGLPIRRSAVSATFRATTTKVGKAVEVPFADRRIVAFGGQDAEDRATLAARRLNDFLDTVPDLFEVQTGEQGEIIGRRRTIFTVKPEDAALENVSVDELQEEVAKNIKSALYSISYRIWDVKL